MDLDNSDSIDRLNIEWVTLNALRGMSKIASQGSISKATYDNSLKLGAALCPEILGNDVSLIKINNYSETAKEFKQKSDSILIRDGENIDPVDLISNEINDYESLVKSSEDTGVNKDEIDQLKRKLSKLYEAYEELSKTSHSEHEIIFRDAYNIQRVIPEINVEKSAKVFELPNGKALRVRVLHPDKIEHITGADLIYERHSPSEEKAALVAVQYKIWKERKLNINQKGLREQISKMESIFCNEGYCSCEKSINDENEYRFPYCSAFIRPTDYLQNTSQKLMSTGENLPICKIKNYISHGPNGGEYLEYNKIKEASLSGELFEFLFNRGKIGSNYFSYTELQEFYDYIMDGAGRKKLIIHAQEF